MRTLLIAFIGGIVGTVFTSMIVIAWTGPTSAPPNGNVSAPINVGGTAQVKNGGLAINALAVFGNSILQATSYLNWGSTSGSSGYGIRDNAGTMEFKNSGGSWATFGSGGRISGEVAAFNLSSCPPGWTTLMSAAGRVIVGIGNNGTNSYSLGASGGADSHTLTVAQLPAHAHTVTDTYPASAGGSFPAGPIAASSGYGLTQNGGATTRTTSSVGSGAPIDVRQAYLALLYCQKT